MKQLLREEDIIGRTIKSTGYSDNVFCLIFTDDTFCIVRWDGADIDISDDKIDLTPSSWNADYLLDMGLITKKEVDKAIRKEEAKNVRDRKKREYNDYLRLKAKYEK